MAEPSTQPDLSYCALASENAQEPLLGSAASGVEHWFLLEYPEMWEPKAPKVSTLAPAVQNHLRALTKARPNVRWQFIRRPRRDTTWGLRLMLAYAVAGETCLYELELTRYEDLLELDLAAWFDHQTPPEEAELVEEPLYLVCNHGRRDRCCAKFGMPIYHALDAAVGERVWQTTHLGGHRFAPTLAVMPSGYCYGRVTLADVAPLVAACDAGRLPSIECLRGRCAYNAAAQVADGTLRKQLDLWHHDDLMLRDQRVLDDTTQRVTFAVGATTHHIDVRQHHSTTSRLASCDKTEATPFSYFAPVDPTT